jgi:TetR/AcrR family transcriptional repressor of nem operon
MFQNLRLGVNLVNMNTVMDPTPRGRPRQFNDDEVLDALVQLFWQKGYGATSLADIVQVSGLSKSSLYSTFGSKDALFEKALDRYLELRSQMVTNFLVNGTEGLGSIDMFLNAIVMELETDPEHRGCLAVNTATELGQTDPGVVEIGERYRNVLRNGVGAAFQRAVELGEIDADQAPIYSNVMLSFVLGTAVIVRSGASDAEILGQIDAGRAMVEGWRRAST